MWRPENEMLIEVVRRGVKRRRRRRLVIGAAAAVLALGLTVGITGLTSTGNTSRRSTTVHVGLTPTVPSTSPPTDAAGVGSGQLSQLTPVGAATAWALVYPATGGARVLRTTDAGTTWTDVTPPQVASEKGDLGLFALNGKQAWISRSIGEEGPTILLATSDGGAHWTTIGPMPLGCQVQFLNRHDGWCPQIAAAAGSESVELGRTTDGGRHWTMASVTAPPIGSPSTPSGLISFVCDKTFSFQSPTLGFASLACDSGTVEMYRTLDGGTTWLPTQMTQPPASTDGQAVGTPVLAGETGAVVSTSSEAVFYRTHDDGRSWTAVYPPAIAKTWTPDVIDPEHWIMVGSRQVMTTDNAGRTWLTTRIDRALTSAHSPGDLPYLVSFTSPATGWALTGPGDPTVFYTANAGKSWTKITVPGTG